MEALTYLLKVTACTVLFFGFYLLVLRKLTFFKINRFYLLGTILLSFAIPALHFEVKREVVAAKTDLVTNLPEVKTAEEPVQLIQPVMVEYQPEIKPEINWLSLIPYAYGAIASVLLLICVWRLFGLLKYTRKYTQNSDGLKLITKTTGFTNCSFFNYVFIDGDKLSDADFAVLLKHEQVHARQYHSADKILLMIAKALLWFNPVIYLYDKALEQVHEYEADEITSASFGNQAYANLLLQLAVTKTNNALIHNFVKSPVKDRIKMLFSAKSSGRRKKTYLLILPMVLGLLWVFAVKFVYAGKQITIENKSQKGFIKPGQSLLNDTINVAKDLRAEYAENIKAGNALLGQELAVKFLGFRDSKQGVLGDVSCQDKIYSFEAITNLGKLSAVKRGDSLKIKINGFSCPEPYNELRLWTNKISASGGRVLYERSLKREPFLYGMNGLRFTFAKIAAIDQDEYHLQRITLKHKNYTIILDVASEQFVNDKIKVGDEISVKFTGEKLIAPDTYFSNQLFELHSRQNKYMLKAKARYSKYQPTGLIGITDSIKNVTRKIKPKIISFSKMTGNAKQKVSIMENAEIDINDNRLTAKYVELDERNGTMVAKNAIFTNSGNNYRLKSDLITFDLKKSGFSFDSGDGVMRTYNGLDELMNSSQRIYNDDAKVWFSAQDSVKMSSDKAVVSLFGNAKLIYNEVVLSGAKIVYNKKKNSVMVNKATMTTGNNEVIKADSLFFNLNTEKARLYGTGFNH